MKRFISYHPFWFTFLIIATFLSAITDVYFAFILKDVVDKSSTSLDVFIQSIVFAVLFLLLSFLLAYLRKVMESLFLEKTTVSYRHNIFNGQLNQSIAKFNSTNTAHYISSLTNDITLIEQDYILNILEIIDNVFIFMISLISLATISFQVTAGIISLGALPLLFPVIFKKVLSKRKLAYSNALGNFTTKIKDFFSGFEVIKTFDIKKRTLENFDHYNEFTEHSKVRYRLLEFFVSDLGSASGSLMHLTTIGICAYMISLGKMTFGDLLAVTQLIKFVINPMVQIATRQNKVNACSGILKKLDDHITYVEKKNKSKMMFNKSIVVEDMSFYFGGKPVLKNINFEFVKGKKYGIIGKSGSGKSTLVKLLMNYYPIQEGNIRIDGESYDRIGDQIYSILSPIHQNVYMFNDTIKDNITLYHTYSNEHVNKTIRDSKLDELLKEKTMGLDTYVAENGNNLSGGEKQRITIARGLIRSSEILVCDEATSALDGKTALEIEKMMLNNNDTTIISVTHSSNENILEMYDDIILMENGKIINCLPYHKLKETADYLRYKKA